jgi:hypothetical protein
VQLLRLPAARGHRRVHQLRRHQEDEVRLHRLPGQGVHLRRAKPQVRRCRRAQEGQRRLPLLARLHQLVAVDGG